MRQNREIEITINLPMDFPAEWSRDDIEFYLNESSHCWDNLITRLREYSARNGCICSICGGRVVADSEKNKTPYPKRPGVKRDWWGALSNVCPNCGLPVHSNEDVNYCGTCGQRLRWLPSERNI